MTNKMRVLMVLALLVVAVVMVSAFAIAVSHGYTLADGLGSMSQFVWFDGATINGNCVPSGGCILGT